MESSEAKLPRQSLKALSLSVSVNGFRKANSALKSWATKMSLLHKPTWQKAGIFEAVMASTTKGFNKNTDLLLGISERWCPDTKSFVFSWGEATITLEDVMLLLGFSVLGSPVFASLDSSGEKIKGKLAKEWEILRRDKVNYRVTQAAWMRRFRDSGHKLEHVAFLALWLSYFVFPTPYCQINEDVFSVAVHLSSGNRIAMAPAVLAHLYADLTLLKDHTRSKSIDKIELNALFKLVQAWTYERFRKLRPKRTNSLLKGEARLALWDDSRLRQRTKSNVRKILENSKMHTFEWRPYTKAVENWKFPKFYPKKAMWVQVDENLDDEVISFARCIKVSELVGLHNVEHYFPNRVASQFGLLQDVPCPVVNRKRHSKKKAWSDYNKPIDGLTLYIPSRSSVSCFTSMFCQWWRKHKRAVESLTPRNIIRGDNASVPVGPSGSKKRKSMKRVCKDDTTEKDEEDDSLTIAQLMRLRKKNTAAAVCSSDENPPKVVPLREVLQNLGKEFPANLKRSRYLRTPTTNVRSEIADSGGSASREVPFNELFLKEVVVKTKREHLGDKRARDDDDDGEICMDSYDNITTAEMIIDREKSVGDTSDSPLGANGGVADTAVSRPKARKNCDDKIGVNGINTEKKKTIVADGSKEAKCLLHKDGENQRSNEKEDAQKSLKQTNLAEIALNLETRMMKVEKTLAKIREWKTTERNLAKNGISA